MAQVDPRLLMQAAMNNQPGAAVGNPVGTPPQMGAPTDALPAGGAAAAPTGAAPNTGAMSNADLSNLVGSGVELSQDPAAIQSMVQMLQDPSIPPDQRAELQMRLQLAALNSLNSGAPSAVGSPGG